MGDQLQVYDDMKFYTTSDKFYLEPTINPTEILVIDRVTGVATVADINTVKIPIPPSAYRPVCGLLGSIKLISGLYLILAKYRILVGKINMCPIYELAGVELVPYNRSNTHLTSKQIEDNKVYESMVRAALDTPGIYFSYSYDLTHSVQRLYSVGPDFHKSSPDTEQRNQNWRTGPKLSLIAPAFPRIELCYSPNMVWHSKTLKMAEERVYLRCSEGTEPPWKHGDGFKASDRLDETELSTGSSAANTISPSTPLREASCCPGDALLMSLVSRAHPNYLWNGFLLRDFSAQQFGRFALPIIQGFVSINRVTVSGQQITWAVVSRRNVNRAGTRHYMRGVDTQGNVANHVETEQIIEKAAGQKCSFVQTRGSIPLYWTQYPDLSYKPIMTVSHEDHVDAYTKHLKDQQQRYGNQVLLNLIDQRGKEEPLERGYRAAVAAAALPGVRYEPFDFHAECRAMRYDRLNVLIDRISHEQEEFGYFLAHGGTIMLQQSGVFRTNCIDCLDRTNVVQSMLARRQLDDALKRLEVQKPDDKSPKLDELFKSVWADHADMISVQYSGTGALKTDFTRTGKRSYMGMIKDGLNSLTRYYKNNFTDGFRQDSIDLVLGKYVVKDGEGHTEPCPLHRQYDWKYYVLPSVLVVAFSMFAWSALFPRCYDTRALMHVLLWGSAVWATLALIYKNGKLFVDWPRLEAGGLAASRSAGQPPL